MPARNAGKCLDVTIERQPNELVVSYIHRLTPNDSLPMYCAFQGTALAVLERLCKVGLGEGPKERSAHRRYSQPPAWSYLRRERDRPFTRCFRWVYSNGRNGCPTHCPEPVLYFSKQSLGTAHYRPLQGPLNEPGNCFC
jgi:hypothetical protein